MHQAKLWLLLGSGLLACSGRYVSSPTDSATVGAADGAGAANSASSSGNRAGAATMGAGGTTGSDSSSAIAGTGTMVGPPPQRIDEAACGVPAGLPQPITTPITNPMRWWFRLSTLIWGDPTHAAPPDLKLVITYEQAGQIADEAIEHAVSETGGIPGATAFVRDWLELTDSSEALLVNWRGLLGRGPALDQLLQVGFDRTRTGVFTEPAFLKARPTISRRGRVMLEALFNQAIPAEPPGRPPFMPPSGLTRREALSEAVSNPICVACHSLFDPAGWSLENFDELGQFVSFDAGQPVDASGSLRLPSTGLELHFKDIADLSSQLVDTCEANLGFADRFLTFALVQTQVPNLAPGALPEADRARVRQAFMRNGRTYGALIKAFAQSESIRED